MTNGEMHPIQVSEKPCAQLEKPCLKLDASIFIVIKPERAYNKRDYQL